jgi:8-oxo-dGTP diphosphatase
MVAAGGVFAPNDEVDEVRWLDPDAAEHLLSYPHDAAVVAAWRELPGAPATLAEGSDT